MHRLRRAAFGTALSALALSVALPDPAAAQGRVDNPVVEAEILPGWTRDDGTRIAAVRLILTPGWHTYWRIPGEAGIAPRLDWGQSQNVASVVPIWPRPQVFDQNGYRSYGYENELILPLEVTAQDPGRPMALIGALAIGVCNETCVPADVTVQGVLRGGGERDRRISGALDTAARPGTRAGLTQATCRLVPEGRGAELTLRATLPPQGRAEDIILELPGSPYRITDSRTWREGDELVAQATLRPPRRSEAVGINRSAIAFTVLSEERMFWSQGCTGS